MRAEKLRSLDRSAALQRQSQLESAHLARLMDVAEAARLSMAPLEDPAPVPRLMLEDHSQTRTAEDAWRGERRAPLSKVKQRPLLSAPEWMTGGFWQLIGGRATA